MALPTTDSWMQGLDLSSRLLGEGGFGGSDYELYEEAGDFVLAIDVPGFDTEDITVAWDDGVLNVSAEAVAEARNRQQAFHRRYRFPKEVDEDAIRAEYNSGVLEVTLPIREDAVAQGKTIPIEG